jgi:hypothetical protein
MKFCIPKCSKLFLLIYGFLITTTILSCKRDQDLIRPKSNQAKQATSTGELKVAEHFNWETSNEIEFEITPTQSGLLLIQGENAEVFHKAYVHAGTSYNPKFSVQNKFTKLNVFFNGKQEKFTLTAKSRIKSNLK